MARRFWIRDADDVINGLSDNDDAEPPDLHTAVLETAIRAADPPGASGRIQGGSTWDGDDIHATVQEAEGAVLEFSVTLSRASSRTVTVDYATSDGTAVAGSDYTHTSGKLTFNAGQTSQTVQVTVLTDQEDESEETLTLTLSNPSQATLDDATGTGAIENGESSSGTQEDPPAEDPPADTPVVSLTATFSNMPATHDGTTFTFDLSFSENVKAGYERIRDHAFTISGGEIANAQRKTQGSNTSPPATSSPAGTCWKPTPAPRPPPPRASSTGSWPAYPSPSAPSRWTADAECQAVFEETCQARGIRLFVLPPRSPKLNGCVERAQRTHTEEFYEVTPFSLEIAALNRELLAWERTYNTVRPHQALGYLTPAEFLNRWAAQRKEAECH